MKQKVKDKLIVGKIMINKVIDMRFGDKGNTAFSGENQLFGVNFKDLDPKDFRSLTMETSTEFGITGQDINKLKKQLGRN